MGLSLGGRVSVFVSDNTPGNSVNCCTSTQWLRMSVFEWKHGLCINIAYVNLVKTSWMYKGEPLIAIPSLILTSCIFDWTGSECWVWGTSRTGIGVSWALRTQLRPFWRGIEKVMCEANLMIVMFHLLNKRKSTSIFQSITSLPNTCQAKLSWISSRSTPPLQPYSHKRTYLFTPPSDAFPVVFVIPFTSGHLYILFWRARKIFGSSS